MELQMLTAFNQVPSPVEMSDQSLSSAILFSLAVDEAFSSSHFLPVLAILYLCLITVGMEKYLTVILISLMPLMTRELCFIIGCT